MKPIRMRKVIGGIRYDTEKAKCINGGRQVLGGHDIL